MVEVKQQPTLVVFIVLISIFIITGLTFIYSSSSVYALEKFGSAHYFVKKQLIGCAIGLVALIICKYLPLEFIKQLTPLAFYSSLFVTALTILPKIGQSIHGSHRWIYVAGISVQPSEFLKVTFIMYLAYLLSKKENKLSSFFYGFLPLLFILAVTCVILLKQPDFGQTVTLCITSFMLFFIAQCRTKHIASTLGLLLPLGGILIYIKPYRIKRVLTFINPWADPHGSGFQIIQSLIAIGSGNITGLGLAQSKQKFFYLPMQHTDFIFSIIAEETGFIGSSLLILLYILFLYCGIKLSSLLKDSFCFYTSLGFILLISLQTVINLFVATGLMPTKGLGLPFISYGNSALICNLAMLGIIINFVYNNRNQDFENF